MPTNRHTRLTALLARIDQQIAEAYEVGADASLTMYELFSVVDCLGNLVESRADVEGKLRAGDA